MHHWLITVLNKLLPSICVLCGAQIESSLDLCPDCCADLPWLQCHCPVCSIPLNTPLAISCGACLQRRPEYSYCISAFEYRYPVDKMIVNFKSKGHQITGQVLANLLAQTIGSRLENRIVPDLILPIPLHRTQLRARGFNQSLEIAKVISTQLGIPLNHRLSSRVKKTRAQKNLSALERKKNLAQAFAITESLNGKRVAIVDDVMTTGCTVESLARLCYQSGAADVQVWVIARTRGHQPAEPGP